MQNNKFLKISHILLGSAFVTFGMLSLIILLYAIFARFFLPTRYSVADQTRSSAVYIAPEEASDELKISDKLVAEKVDLERKMIQVSSPAEAEQVAEAARQAGAEIIKQEGELVVARVPKAVEADFENELKTVEGASLEIDYPTRLAADDPDWGVLKIEAPEVWETTTAEGLTVAVIDTGIDYTHPDLSARYAGGRNVINDTDDPFDDHGHGTHVAGTIAADLNQAGLAGVAPQANIYAVKALAADGTGYVSDLVEAIDWAMEQNAAIINFSLGTTYDSSILESKLQEAANQGLFLVAAAGNTSGGSLLYPAAYNTVVAVAATDSSDNLASFSSLGAEIAAPGVNINSTVPGGGYASYSGTSMAAPHVSATVALMLANEQENIRENLRNSAVDLGPAGADPYFGYGLVHAKPAALGIDVLAPAVTFLEPEHESVVTAEVEIKIKVQDESQIKQIILSVDSQQLKTWQEAEIKDQEEFSYLWQTNGLDEGIYTLVVEATDEYDNAGQARVEVTVEHDLEPSPTTNPELTPPGGMRGAQGDESGLNLPERSRAEQNVPTQAPAWSARERNSEMVQDSQPEADSLEPDSASETDSSSYQESEQVPAVTNLNQRNPRPQTNRTSAASDKSTQSPGRAPQVRGTQSINWWQLILSWFQ
jgi:hypothetical protein